MADKIGSANHQEERNKNKVLIAVCIAAVLVIAVLLGIIIMMMSREGVHTGEGDILGDKTEESKRPVLLTEDNVGEVIKQAEQQEKKEMPLQYQVTMNSTWEFEDSKSASKNAYVANSVNNKTAVYFDVVRNDTEEVIYQSPVIPVGKYLDSVTLDKDLDAGNYECTLTYHLVDDDQNTLTTVNMWLMVKVMN